MNADERSLLLESSYDELCTLIADETDKTFLTEFFNCLFTEAERKDFAERWLLVKEIDSGTTQREIARKFNLSLCKITRGSRELKKKESAFCRMLQKLRSRASE
ncbi:MAG: Trp family transcriptional regulator [Treponema sp.]